MIALLLLALAQAADPAQAVADREWRRMSPAELVEVGEGTRLAVALGRLRDPDALAPLLALRGEPETDRAVAEALAFVPGAAPAIRSWLDEIAPATPADLHGAHRSLRPVLLASLGHHAEAADVERLAAALAEPWPAAGAAAIALGRLGRAEVEGVGRSVPALVATLGRPDPRTVQAAAFGLFRVGMATASPGEVALALRLAHAGPTGPARAWALRAAWPRLTVEERRLLLDAAVRDPEPVVTVAALDSAGEGDVPAAVLAPLLEAEHPWVRRAAVGALGRVGGPEAVEVLASQGMEGTPWRSADVVSALAAAGSPMSPTLGSSDVWAAPIRAAAAATVTDPARLAELARSDREPAVRTAAAGALLALDLVPIELVEGLLAAEDPAVREAAVALLEPHPDEVAVPLLAARAAEESSAMVLAGLYDQLLDREAEVAVPFDHPLSGYAGQKARALAEALGVPPPVVTGPQVDLSAVAHVRSARVVTSRGAFVLTLDPETAPVAVDTFARLAEDGFFDGIVFHRVVPAFVIQTGDPRGDGWGGPGFTIPDEVSAIPYTAGAVGMARADRDTGGSQWFVTLTPQPHLVGDYTLFGHVSHGMEVVRRIERGDTIRSVTVERVP